MAWTLPNPYGHHQISPRQTAAPGSMRPLHSCIWLLADALDHVPATAVPMLAGAHAVCSLMNPVRHSLQHLCLLKLHQLHTHGTVCNRAPSTSFTGCPRNILKEGSLPIASVHQRHGRSPKLAAPSTQQRLGTRTPRAAEGSLRGTSKSEEQGLWPVRRIAVRVGGWFCVSHDSELSSSGPFDRRRGGSLFGGSVCDAARRDGLCGSRGRNSRWQLRRARLLLL